MFIDNHLFLHAFLVPSGFSRHPYQLLEKVVVTHHYFLEQPIPSLTSSRCGRISTNMVPSHGQSDGLHVGPVLRSSDGGGGVRIWSCARHLELFDRVRRCCQYHACARGQPHKLVGEPHWRENIEMFLTSSARFTSRFDWMGYVS